MVIGVNSTTTAVTQTNMPTHPALNQKQCRNPSVLKRRSDSFCVSWNRAVDMVDTETTPFVDSSVHWSYLPVLDVFCFFFLFRQPKSTWSSCLCSVFRCFPTSCPGGRLDFTDAFIILYYSAYRTIEWLFLWNSHSVKPTTNSKLLSVLTGMSTL